MKHLLTAVLLSAATCAASQFDLTIWPSNGGQIVTGTWPSYDFVTPQLPYIEGGLNSGAIEGFRFCEVNGCQQFDEPQQGYALYLYSGGLVVRSPYVAFPASQLAEIGRSLNQGVLQGFEWSMGGHNTGHGNPENTPEPGTWAMALTGVSAVIGGRRIRNNAKRSNYIYRSVPSVSV